MSRKAYLSLFHKLHLHELLAACVSTSHIEGEKVSIGFSFPLGVVRIILLQLLLGLRER